MSEETDPVRPHLRALFERYNPSTPMRRVIEEAGVPETPVTKWFKRTTTTTRIPDLDDITMLAEVIGCTPDEVFLAFREDHGYVFDDYAADRKHRLLEIWDRLTADQQDLLLGLAQAPEAVTVVMAAFHEMGAIEQELFTKVAQAFITER